MAVAARSWFWLVGFMLLISACAGPAVPAPPPAEAEPVPETPPPHQAEPAPAPVQEEPKPPAEPVREEVPGGFRVGGPEHLWFPEWLDDQRLQFRFSRGQEYVLAEVSVGGGPVRTGPVPPAARRDRFMSENVKIGRAHV